MHISTAEKTTPRMRGTTAEIQAMAQWMRDHMTDAETRLWGALQGRRLAGLRFRAQHPVGRFILDFYCPACKLAVEVDGPIHEFQHGRDEDRTTILSAYGYDLIRFSNEEVMSQLLGVLTRIQCAARLAGPASDSALPAPNNGGAGRKRAGEEDSSFPVPPLLGARGPLSGAGGPL